MKRMGIALIAVGVMLTAVSMGYAKDLTTTGLEEAFIDAVGTCGPSSSVAGSLGKSTDPAVKIALRDALIIEAADDAANVPGANAAHAACMKKELDGRGYSANQEAALPYCVKHDWPDPFSNLGSCIHNHGRLEGALGK
jgi:hypothetical protein